jgi:HSP20 family molecular chaperone IbpA
MASRLPSDWMFAQACEMLEQAERMQRSFFRLAAATPAPALWEPPVDVFENEHEVTVIIALPGVAPDAVEISVEAGVLAVRAQGPVPFTASRAVVHQLEIPYGRFERRVALPAGAFDAATREARNGLVIVRLHKQARAE